MDKLFRNHDVVKYVRKYCKLNKWKMLISNKRQGNYLDPNANTIHIEDTSDKSLSYKLFILAHEYGHLFQLIVDQDALNTNKLNDVLYNKLMNGEYVIPRKKKQVIRALLTEEYRATTIGLQLLRSMDSYPAKPTMRFIMRQANMNLIKYYMHLNYSYDTSSMKEFKNDIPDDSFIIPYSDEFNALVNRIKICIDTTTKHPKLYREYNTRG